MKLWPLLLVVAAPIKPEEDPAARDLKAMEGTWVVVSHEVNGKKATGEGFASWKELVIKDGKLHMYDEPSPIKIDPTKSPKEINVYFPGAMMLNAHSKGIYELEKDELRISLPLSVVTERPKKLTSDKASLFVLRRKK
jgi:uncharacterized protein (TIGR03067 family)